MSIGALVEKMLCGTQQGPHRRNKKVRSAYIWASAFWQVSVLAGGSTLTYLSGNGWWVGGAVILVLMGSAGLKSRLDAWRDEDSRNRYDWER